MSDDKPILGSIVQLTQGPGLVGQPLGGEGALWAAGEPARLAASLASAQQRIEELERLLARIRQWDHLDTAGDGAFWRREIDAACAVATATRPSKGFLKGESPQATWPFAQDDKGSE